MEIHDLDAARQLIEAWHDIAQDEAERMDVAMCSAFERLRRGDLRSTVLAAASIVENQATDQRQRAHALWLLAEVGAASGDTANSTLLLEQAALLASAPPRPWLLNQIAALRARLPEGKKGVS